MDKVTLLAQRRRERLGAGSFCRKLRGGEAEGEGKGKKAHLGHRLQGRDADAGELFSRAHKASQFEKRLGQRRGSWSEIEASVPRTFDSIPSLVSSLRQGRQRDSEQPQRLE